MIKTLVLRLENRPSLRKCRFMDYMVNKRFSFAVLEITGTLAGAIFLDVCRNRQVHSFYFDEMFCTQIFDSELRAVSNL